MIDVALTAHKAKGSVDTATNFRRPPDRSPAPALRPGWLSNPRVLRVSVAVHFTGFHPDAVRSPEKRLRRGFERVSSAGCAP